MGSPVFYTVLRGLCFQRKEKAVVHFFDFVPLLATEREFIVGREASVEV